jgi:hypothetical protein
MAQRVITTLVDDVDGGAAVETVHFALDGATYTIDLSEQNAAKLRDALIPYLTNGSRQGRSTTTAARAPKAGGDRRDKAQTQAIRDWANANGHQVSARGRLAQGVVDAYEAAHAVV